MKLKNSYLNFKIKKINNSFSALFPYKIKIIKFKTHGRIKLPKRNREWHKALISSFEILETPRT